MHKMELKNMSWNKYYSRQTHCYKLTVYWEGERVFKASNDGGGAQTEYFACKDHSKQGFESSFKMVGDYCIKYAMESNPDFFEVIMHRNGYGNLCIEYLINKLLNDSFILSNMKKIIKNRVCLLDGDGRIFSIKMRPLDKTLDFISKQVDAEIYKPFRIMNDMSETEQLTHWRTLTDSRKRDD